LKCSNRALSGRICRRVRAMNGSGDTYAFQTLERSMHEFAANIHAVAEHAMREGRRSDGGRQHCNAENAASSANVACQPAHGRCLGQASRMTAPAAGAAATQPYADALGDITNMVHANRSFKIPKAVNVLHPQPSQTQPVLGAVPYPPPVAVQVSTLVRMTSLQETEQLFSAALERDAQDPQRASEYATDVFVQMLESELLHLPKPDYMEEQTDINAKMRAILVDWLVEVHTKYRLRKETLFLTANIIDRYLSVRPVMRRKLQLLGVVAMFIASKYEEIDPPKVSEFSYITDHTFSKEEIKAMECAVLAALEFQITVPTIAHVFDRLARANGCDTLQRSFAQYVLELNLCDVRQVHLPPSQLVSAALLLSNEWMGRRPAWPAAMAHHSRRSETSLRPVVSHMRAVLDLAPNATLQAVRRKYQQDKYNAVANLRPRE